MRLFIACELPEAWRSALADQQAALRRALGPDAGALRWVRPEGCHLTLLFLGETPQAQEPRIISGLAAAAEGVVPFALRLGRCGSFGGRSPRVVWTGLEGDLAPLAQLQRRVVQALGAASGEAVRFSPHITLARVSRPLDTARLSRAIAAVPSPVVPPLTVEAVALIESELRPSGAVYTRRHAAALAASAPPN